MKILVYDFNLFREKHILLKLVSFGISKFATDGPKENFLVYNLLVWKVRSQQKWQELLYFSEKHYILHQTSFLEQIYIKNW